MKISKIERVIATITLLAASVVANADDLFVLGPIEQISQQSIRVLGQTFTFDRESISDALEVGIFVAVVAKPLRGLEAGVSIVQLVHVPYVPGASDVALAGNVSKYDKANGCLTIDGLVVNIVDALRDPNTQFAIGERVEVLGRQPQPNGRMLASKIWKRDTPGAGLLRSSSIATIGARAITGIGFSPQAITGTGFSAQAITGTGFGTQAITGTGLSTQAITGTGLGTQAITGTGVQKQAITGTGRSR